MIVFALKCINFEKTFLSSSHRPRKKAASPQRKPAGITMGTERNGKKADSCPAGAYGSPGGNFPGTVLSAFIFYSELLFRRSRDPSFPLPRQDDPANLRSRHPVRHGYSRCPPCRSGAVCDKRRWQSPEYPGRHFHSPDPAPCQGCQRPDR